MAKSIEGISGQIWDDYYEKFEAYFSRDLVRDGCHPLIFEQVEPTDKAIVLVHGLSDSPYFMSAIGEYFYQKLGYNVYLPLLHFHGLKDPKEMEGVELEEWKANVRFAINVAEDNAEKVSIGGLSTGGALGFYMAATSPRIDGALYLFSAALDLAGGRLGLIGEVKERVLRTFWPDLLKPILNRNAPPLVGDNPYGYSHVDLDGAQELARLIKETDILLKGFSHKARFAKRVFAAHSESDTTASLEGIRELQSVSDPTLFHPYIFHKDLEISHASLVLEDTIANNEGQIIKDANPQFAEMMTEIKQFQDGN
ncbi:carboxylesterase [Acaryochloris marina]|uniref:alpha/beta hydrolase n=1 Tax=Acaryochloris marina TaxID=155978 RepID=UPI001BAFA81C|nr:alpha/beta hydrolase [Acaryochloris marina]QUY46152.1 alpha/beta hydrolase [Acaryochloris marina S15]